MWDRFAPAPSLPTVLRLPFASKRSMTPGDPAESFSCFPPAGLRLGTCSFFISDSISEQSFRDLRKSTKYGLDVSTSTFSIGNPIFFSYTKLNERTDGAAMDHIKEFFRKDRFAEYVGIELLEVSEGSARARMEVKEHHLNGVGIVHGAAIFSLADLAFAVASNSHGTVALAINADISFMKAATKGAVLYADAREVSRNPKLASYTIRITDGDGDLIALFQGMVYRKKDRLE